MTELDSSLRRILPLTADVGDSGHLVVGGCDTVELAREFGTPLYVFDEEDLRARCREFRQEFEARHPDALIVYAAKAYLGRALARLIAEEGLGLDVVSGGELACASAVGFPLDRVYFHGNNKSPQEVRQALTAGVGRVVVDNFHDLALLGDAATASRRRQAVLLRVTPGVDPHTHAYVSTGAVDSKFGLPLVGGRAEEALVQALASPGLEVVGLHYHLGSQITETEPYRKSTEVVLEFAARMSKRHGLEVREYSVGGGMAMPYTRDAEAPSVAEYADTVVDALREGCGRHQLPLPMLTVEPGRAIVARAGVALYTVGATKEVPGVRTYVAVDGGMADNIRPALYGARYEALVANRMTDPPQDKVTVAGRYCESGDVLVPDVALPRLWAGDILALPVSGAYALALASNYNWALRPAVVMVKDGRARLIHRRETYDDLLACDVFDGTPVLPAPDSVVAAVCQHFSVSREDIVSKGRDPHLTRPRRIAIYLLREDARRTFAEIGLLLGGREAGTAFQGYSRFQQELALLPQTHEQVECVRRILRDEPASASARGGPSGRRP